MDLLDVSKVLNWVLENSGVTVIGIVISIYSFIFGNRYVRTKEFISSIEKFKNKLPTEDKSATPMSEDLQYKLNIAELSPYISLIDLSNQEVLLLKNEKAEFQNYLTNYPYNKILFPVYYKKYSQNIVRLLKSKDDIGLNISLIKDIIHDTKHNPLEPIDVFEHQLKYYWKVSSWLYINIYLKLKTN